MSRKTRSRKYYTPQFKAAARILAEAQGWPADPGALARVADHLGVERRLVKTWAQRWRETGSTATISVRKDVSSKELTAVIFGVAWEILAALSNRDLLEETGTKDLAVALGILIDKAQLLSGQPTELVQQSLLLGLRERLAPWTQEQLEADEPAPALPLSDAVEAAIEADFSDDST